MGRRSGSPRDAGRALAVLLPLLAAAWLAAVPPGEGHGAPPALGRPRYEDVASEVGLGGFLHAGYLGGDPDLGPPKFPEISGPGACWLDADRDGWLDLYLVSGLYLTEWDKNLERDPRSKLYRNLGDGTFADASRGSGADLFGAGQGCAAADYDDDGDPDLVVTQWGGNVLLRNRGDGTFENVTWQAGIRDERCGAFACWGSSATWWDFDLDGCLDLFVARFGDYDADDPPPGNGPEQAPGQRNSLYRSRCDGTFADVAEAAGMTQRSNSWGSVSGDFDADGWPDLFVANDGDVNDLYLNKGDRTFRRIGFDARHGMGIAHGDYDHDGRLDVAITNYVGEHNAILRGLGNASFEDLGDEHPFTDAWPYSGWATHWGDLQNDGHPDLFVVNGMTEVTNIPLKEPVLVYEHSGASWRVVRDDVGYDVSGRTYVGRGGAWADYDDDGDLDWVLAEAGENPTHLFRAEAPGGNMLLLELVGAGAGGRDAIGAKVKVTAAGLAPQHLEKVAGSGFLSSNDPRLHVGLAYAEAADVEVRWPNGTLQAWQGVRANSWLRLRQGVADAEVVKPLPLVRIVGGASVPRAVAQPYRVEADLGGGAALAEARWDFGEGQPPVRGTSVEHAFRDIGTFFVTARVTDSLGRAKSQVLRVAVHDTLRADVAMPKAVFLPSDSVQGAVTVRFSNGDPVRNATAWVKVNFSSGDPAVDAFLATQPSWVQRAAGYRETWAVGVTNREGRFGFNVQPNVGWNDVDTPLHHPGVYSVRAWGGARGASFDEVATAYRVGVPLTLAAPGG